MSCLCDSLHSNHQYWSLLFIVNQHPAVLVCSNWVWPISIRKLKYHITVLEVSFLGKPLLTKSAWNVMPFAVCRPRLDGREKNVLNVCECVFLSAALWKMPVNLLTPLIVSVGVGPPPSQNESADPEVKRWPAQLFLPLGRTTPSTPPRSS